MIAFARDHRNEKYRTARWQLIRERNGKRFLHQPRIGRTSQRVVIILLFFDARRLQTKLVELVPSFLVAITANDRKNRRTQVGREGRWIDEIFFETFATARDNFRIV